MRTFLSHLSLLCILVAGCTSTKVSKSSSGTVELSIIQTNDVYEIGALGGGRIGGMARLATLSKEVRAQNPNTFSVLAGDFLNPSVMGLAKVDGERIRGKQMVDMMNQVGIDWVVFGNHEFDIPYDDLQKRINESEFGWIGGNVYHWVDAQSWPFVKEKGGLRENLPRHTIWEVPVPGSEAIRIGVLGVCLDVNQPDFVRYEDVFESAREDFEVLQQQSDFVIALTHLEIAQDRELARRLPELRLIMGGHDHTNMREIIGTVPITKADANAKTAYIHRLKIDPKTKNVQVNSTLRALDESVVPDPEIEAKVKAWESLAYASFEEQGLPVREAVSTLAEPLDGLESHIRYGPTNLGQQVAASMKEAGNKLDCAFINSGSIRLDDYLSGTITFFDLIRAMPFGGKVLTVEMTGKVLAQVLDAGEGNKGMGGYLQVAGISGTSSAWKINQQSLQADKVYRIATSDFLMSGRESNLGFLTADNPGISKIEEPGADDINRDIRLVFAEYLKKK